MISWLLAAHSLTTGRMNPDLRPSNPQAQNITVATKDTIETERVVVHVEIEAAPKTLDRGDGAG